MADINIQEVTNHINIETANGYNLEFNGQVVNMNVVLSNYYTKTETDALLNGKADKADTYTISQINDMVQDMNTAIDTKQNLITGAASTITNSNLTTNRAVISNASGKVAVSNVTSTELGYLSGVTSSVQTQLNNKASTSLDNLTANGQMIIDSQNGTISNCILEIPQNLKLTLENNVLTLKSGSIITLMGSTYATVTTSSDVSRTYSGLDSSQLYYVFCSSSGTSLTSLYKIENVWSGTTAPEVSISGRVFYNSNDKYAYSSSASGWNTTPWNVAYPLAILQTDSNGNLSFAKDSNGNDMIFNGAGFIGHHAFVYPNVKALMSDGFDTDGSLNSWNFISNKLTIFELNTVNNALMCNRFSSNFYLNKVGIDLDFTDDIQDTFNWHYIKTLNKFYRRTTELQTDIICPFVKYAYDGTTVTDFAIRQPYQGARNLLTDDLYKQIGDVETLLAAI